MAHPKRREDLTAREALEILKAGNARFVAGKGTHRNLPASVRATASGQNPFGAIVSCMDSRVPIELVFDLTIGDAFSLRVAGNVVNSDILASLEFATKLAGAKLILVLGHTRCSAVQGAIDGVSFGNLTATLAKLAPAVSAAGPRTSGGDGFADRVARLNVRNAMAEIRSTSPVLRELLEGDAVRLAGGLYDIQTGKATFFDGEE